MERYVPAAVATLLVSDAQILLGKRYDKKQFTGWQCPGGFMQLNESLESAAQRCCLQKAGIQINNIEQGPFTNNLFNSDSHISHSVTLYTIAHEFDVINSQVYADENLSWQWFKINEIPDAVFQPLQQLINSHDISKLLRL